MGERLESPYLHPEKIKHKPWPFNNEAFLLGIRDNMKVNKLVVKKIERENDNIQLLP